MSYGKLIRELHTKYYFFVANLLATDVAFVIAIARNAVECLITCLVWILIILATAIIQFVVPPIVTILFMMNILLPTTIAIERMSVISSPYHHRSIMTTKMVIGILAVQCA